jgi:hypothetical protein
MRPCKDEQIWNALRDGCAAVLECDSTIRTAIDKVWDSRHHYFSDSHQGDRREYRFQRSHELFEKFLEVGEEVLALEGTSFSHLISNDDLSLLSLFCMEKGTYIPPHEDRGILTFIYSPNSHSESNSGSSGGCSTLIVMAGSTLCASSENNSIPALQHSVATVSGTRYSLVFRLRGCSTAQLHRIGGGMTVGDHLAIFESTHSSVNKSVVVTGSMLPSTIGNSSNQSLRCTDLDEACSGITGFIRDLANIRDRRIAEV